MADLERPYRILCRRLDRCEQDFSMVVATTLTSRQKWLITEGILSHCWQAWCGFCRDVIISSTAGGTTRTGTVLPAVVAPATWQRVSHVAIRAAQNHTISPGINSVLRKEPTWGDITVLGNIVANMNPANAATLTSTFGSLSGGPIHLQKVRNAAAHINQQTMAELSTIRTYYVVTSLRHPVDAAFWTDPLQKDYAFIAWLDDMRTVADYATR